MDHDIQEGILNFTFDHIYACHTENVDIVNDSVLHNYENDQAHHEIMQLKSRLNSSLRENCKLKDLVLINLDLLQQQSDEITQKDREISLYQQEVEKLKLLLNQAEGGSINLRLQNLNPPPLIHLTTPCQPVTILPESTNQVQYTSISSIISSHSGSIVTKKSLDKKHDTITSYAEALPCTKVGSLIDTRYLQCTDSVFETQPNICIQNLPVIQTKIQPIIQNKIQPIVQNKIQPIIQKIQPIIQNKIQPIIHAKIQPIIQNKFQPIIQNKFQPIIQNKFQPIIQNKIQPIIQNKIQPIIQNKIQPIIQNKIQPIIQNKIQPIIQNKIQPIIQNKFQPIIQNKIQPIIQNKIQPIIQNKIQPIIQNKIQPIIQNKIQPIIQNKIQPIIQTSIHSVGKAPLTVIQSAGGNPVHFKSIQMNKIPICNSIAANLFDNEKRLKNTEYVITKETGSRIGETHFLTLNKKCKTIFTYEKSSKKNVKKIIKTTGPICDLSNKLQKSKDQLHSFTPIIVGKGHSENFIVANSLKSEKSPFPKYSSFLNNELSVKSDHEYLSNVIIPETVSPIKIATNEVKSTQRRFFTSSLKEKVSCRDFSYGESLGNIKYDVKTDILEYLEGNNSNSQTEIDIIDTNFDNDIYSINNLSPRSESPIDIDKKIGIRESLDDSIILQDEIMDKMMESKKNPTSSYLYSHNKMYMGSYLNTQYGKSKTNKKRTTSTLSSQSNESPTNNTPQSSSKTTANKKRNVRRKRALSSASKVSTISHSDSPLPYSWSFSGQDFKILFDDIKSNYFMPVFGSNQSYFSSMQLNSKEEAKDTVSLEVPSWRIKVYTPDEYIHTTENVDEESYLKRHLKMETEEKRRKRWDFQMIREQRHIEKLKQRQERRNSGGFKHGRNSKVVCSTFTEEEPSSFYPSPDDLFSIEIRDSLPVTAFGECIPDLPPRPFQLPWVRSCSHKHSRGRSSGKKKAKHCKGEEG
ncbi:uncharacterized protein LOC143922573 [Arctopsyche grandis]|uniref:uncharacterized protein LOC143922573 n=1 Tax=Arctopsyche grandis TaxID=121162 RepID=UPI00406D84A1